MKSHSFQFQDGTETTCWKDHPAPHGTKVQSSLKPLTTSSHQKDQLKNHSDFHYKTSTKSVVSEPSQSEELKLVSLNQVCQSVSPQLMSRLKSNQLKCITLQSLKLFQVTTSDSTLKVFQLKILKEDLSVVTPRTTHPNKLKTS